MFIAKIPGISENFLSHCYNAVNSEVYRSNTRDTRTQKDFDSRGTYSVASGSFQDVSALTRVKPGSRSRSSPGTGVETPPHGFLDGKIPTSMWNVRGLYDMICDQLDQDPDVVSDFSSWSQVWGTALGFSGYPHDSVGAGLEDEIPLVDPGELSSSSPTMGADKSR